MKKVIVSLSTIMIFASSIFISCKKDNNALPSSADPAPKMKSMASSAATKVSVDARGFLVFASPTDVDNYVVFLQSNSLESIKNYNKSIGFISLAGQKYDGSDQKGLITDNQVKDFLLDMNGLIQVSGTVFKPTKDNIYLLTMQAINLNDMRLTLIVSETFEAGYMNRFVINQDRTDDFNLFEYITLNQAGTREILYPGGGDASTMKFWGTSERANPCDAGGMQLVIVTHYAFWFKTFTQYWRPCVN